VGEHFFADTHIFVGAGLARNCRNQPDISNPFECTQYRDVAHTVETLHATSLQDFRSWYGVAN
jgi:hypothetical protein